MRRAVACLDIQRHEERTGTTAALRTSSTARWSCLCQLESQLGDCVLAAYRRNLTPNCQPRLPSNSHSRTKRKCLIFIVWITSSLGSWLSGDQGDREWGRGREHFSGFWALDGGKPGPRVDPQEPAAMRSCCAFRRSGRVSWNRELVGPPGFEPGTKRL